jgi:hypothetical protein
MTSKEKYLICFKCDQLKNRICQKCNCFMPVKVLIPFAKCPENKWNKE